MKNYILWSFYSKTNIRKLDIILFHHHSVGHCWVQASSYPIHNLQEATSMSLCFVSVFGRESRDERGDAIQSTTLPRECGGCSLASPRLVPRQCEAPRESLYEASEMRFWTLHFAGQTKWYETSSSFPSLYSTELLFYSKYRNCVTTYS